MQDGGNKKKTERYCTNPQCPAFRITGTPTWLGTGEKFAYFRQKCRSCKERYAWNTHEALEEPGTIIYEDVVIG